ncbi:putative ATPases involved in chromosome partitioning-like protein [Thiocapsa sp. KS1]|jgi:chromosome partitioning protein|nr:ParA family protein [Thiocapsa sp. KS1]CRI64315.1 putative ATPases involved in chromosome partitioning-like protein [Thiocapsa sp. KS1]
MSTALVAPPRIAFWHRKGGTGKTSLAIGCAVRLACGFAPNGDAERHSPAPGARVLLLDTDPQGTAAAWGERFADRFGIAVRADSGFALWRDWAERANRFDAVLVDCPPTVSPEVVGILAGVDRLLVPTRPAWPDVWALESVADLVADLHRRGARLAVSVVFNQVGDEALAPFAAAIADLGLGLLPEAIPRDDAWPALFSGGEPPDRVATLVGKLVRPTGIQLT